MLIEPKLLAFDFDGVIADTFKLFTRLAHENYGVEIDYDAIADYEFIDALDLPRSETLALIDELTYRSHELGLEPLDGALETLNHLSARGPQLIVTARPVSEPVSIWLKERLPQAEFMIEATGSPAAKLAVLQERGIRYFVDDRLDTCAQLSEHGLTPLVFEQPWNREKAHDFVTVSCWREIAELINW